MFAPIPTNAERPYAAADLSALLAQFGSPLYVYEEGLLTEQIRAFREIFDDVADVYYAAFCNSNPFLLQVIRRGGLRCLVSSSTELRLAQWAGFPIERTLVTGSAFSTAELQNFGAQELGINLDSFGQLEKFARSGKRRTAGVRVNMDVSFGDGAVLTNSCIGTHSRVGILDCELDAFVERATSLGIVVNSLHVYTGTNQQDAELLLRAAERLVALAIDIPSVKILNLGGGFGLPYRTDESGFPWRGFVMGLQALRERVMKAHGREIKFAVEPGRAVIGPTGWLACTVQDVKVRGDGAIFVGVDGSLSNFPRPYIYGSAGQHPISVLPKRAGANPVRVAVCGNALASGDRLADDVYLKGLPHEGDMVIIHDAGAYGYSMSSQFSGRLRPAEVLITTNGTPTLIRPRETVDLLLPILGYASAGTDRQRPALSLKD